MLVILSLYTYAVETPIGFSVKCVRNFNLKTAEYTVPNGNSFIKT